ncbi:MAG: hypothetical protein U0670_09000 [Anaerolineae bacterium]
MFSEFTPSEMRSLIPNLVAILPQRGCIQRCTGCHASAIPHLASADWETTTLIIDALAEAAHQAQVPVGSAFPQPLIETFRDSDPAHLRLHSSDGKQRGIGDYAALLYERLGQRAKIMTSGIRARLEDDVLRINRVDLHQIELAAEYSGRISISVSIETLQYRTLGAAQDAAILARTLESVIIGSLRNGHAPELFLDVMFFSSDGQDPLTKETLQLLAQIFALLDRQLIDTAALNRLHKRLQQPIDGHVNQRFTVEGLPFGVRTSPHLNIGRAAVTGRGQPLIQAVPTDRLNILPGDPADRLVVNGRTFTRGALSQNLEQRHLLLEMLRDLRGAGFLSETDAIDGSPLHFFRAEIDLTSAQPLKLAGRAIAPGVNLPPGVNLLVSNPAGGELQAVIPYKPLTL